MWQWLENSWISVFINNNTPFSLAVEFMHYFSMFMLVGTTVIVDLRLLGLAAKNRNVGDLAEQLFPWMWVGLAFNLVTGFLMFAGNAVEYSVNNVFFVKMGLMVAAIVFGAIVQSGSRKWNPVPVGAKLVAFISIVLWLATILAGVEIPALTGVG